MIAPTIKLSAYERCINKTTHYDTVDSKLVDELLDEHEKLRNELQELEKSVGSLGNAVCEYFLEQELMALKEFRTFICTAIYCCDEFEAKLKMPISEDSVRNQAAGVFQNILVGAKAIGIDVEARK
jgi:hypothetical protein